MSKASKTKRSDKRKKAKQSAKAAKKALYLQYAAEGRKNGSKRAKLHNRKKAKPNKHAHLMSDCGNVGCHRCYPSTGNLPNGKRQRLLTLTAVA